MTQYQPPINLYWKIGKFNQKFFDRRIDDVYIYGISRAAVHHNLPRSKFYTPVWTRVDRHRPWYLTANDRGILKMKTMSETNRKTFSSRSHPKTDKNDCRFSFQPRMKSNVTAWNQIFCFSKIRTNRLAKITFYLVPARMDGPRTDRLR